MSNEDPIAVEAGDAAIVSKAMIRAAEQLDIPNHTLAGIIGIPETTVIQMRLGDAVLPSDAKAFESAILFIRIRSLLSSLTGDHGSASKSWLEIPNTALGERPIEVMQADAGLMRIIDDLESRRNP